MHDVHAYLQMPVYMYVCIGKQFLEFPFLLYLVQRMWMCALAEIYVHMYICIHRCIHKYIPVCKKNCIFYAFRVKERGNFRR